MLLLSGLLITSLIGCQTQEKSSNAYQIETLNQTIGGPKGIAQPGDFVIQNNKIRAAIIGNRPSMGPHTAGGSIADADIQRVGAQYANGFGNDQLAEVFSTVNMNTALIDDENGEVRILNNGENGEPAHICASGVAFPFISLLQAIWGINAWLDEEQFLSYSIRTDYILAPDDHVLTIQTNILVGENDGCDHDLSNVIEITDAKEFIGTETKLMDIVLDLGYLTGDFYLQGGSLNVFTPNIGFDEGGHIDELNREQVNTFTTPIPVDFLAGVGDKISYGLMYPKARMYVPLFTSSQTATMGGAIIPSEEELQKPGGRFPDGTIIRYERWFAVGQGDVGSILDAFLLQTQKNNPEYALGEVSGRVIENYTGKSVSDAMVFVYQVQEDGSVADAPWSQWTTDVGDVPNPNGLFSGYLPVGAYELEVYQTGRPKAERLRINLTEQGIEDIVLTAAVPGHVHFSIVDEQNRHLPAKISFFTADGTSVRDPVLGDSFIAGDPAAIIFADQGVGSVVLPPGEYYAVASRGIEYELGQSSVFAVKENSRTDINLQIIRSVDTAGWISADFHVHSFPSHDSGVSAEKRVKTMACEGVEYFTPTDHDYVSDFRPAIQDLGLEYWLNSAPGLEVTTLEVGHYLGFPVRINTIADAGGAIDWTARTPQEIIDDMRELKDPNQEVEPVVFVGHPRDGILGYFDQYGLVSYDTEDDAPSFDANILSTALLSTMTSNLANADILKPENFSTDFDAIEILGGKRFDFLRTPLASELENYKELKQEIGNNPELIYALNTTYAYKINTRTMEEQQQLIDAAALYDEGEDMENLVRFDGSFNGQIDDWFSLLNLGFRYTALGNSDTHGTTTVESGCPRNYVFVGEDDPILIDDDVVAQAVKDGKVVASFGPFVEFYAHNDKNQTVGSTITPASDGSVVLNIDIQAPTWISVERIEIYENGTLIEDVMLEQAINTPNEIYRYSGTHTYTPEKDSWYVVIVIGAEGSDLAPLFTNVERDVLQLQDIITNALGDSSAVPSLLLDFLAPYPPIPRSHPVLPMALTNPIWVDQDGDNSFTPPGLPSWLRNPND